MQCPGDDDQVSSPPALVTDVSPFLRQTPYESIVRVTRAAALLYFLSGLAFVPGLSLSAHDTFDYPDLLWWLVGYSMLVGAGLWEFARRLSPATFLSVVPRVGFSAMMSAGILVSLILLGTGPSLGAAAILYLEAPIFGVYLMHRRWAITMIVAMGLEYGVVLAIQTDAHHGLAQWLVVMAALVTTAVLVGGIVERTERSAEAERRAKEELADLNENLEMRVRDQVDELERTGRLRRFLAPQVADAVTSHDSAVLLAPHRQVVAVFFCDLRGFTAFTNTARAEEALTTLNDYYDAVGAVLQRHHATIGGFAGDGIMAYFGDPVPDPHPARTAIAMTLDLREALKQLTGRWADAGHQLHYGVGLALGEATLGMVGFEGRHDYTPLGAVVNLAARLCSQARAGQVLLDQAIHEATAPQAPSGHYADMELKGYSTKVPVYQLTPN